ncbi:hypothetical protein JW998_07880 [candidate division KSB1 bacterium]|nr:hypothetical protein [candidate division KSB1 bacterium]
MRMFLLLLIAGVVTLSCTSKNRKAVPEVSKLAMDELDIAMGSAGTPQRVTGSIMQINDADPVPELLALVEQEAIFKLQKPKDELQLLKKETDDLGFQHLTFGRRHNGIDIWGDEIKFHINDKNELYRIDADYQPSLPEDLATSTTLTSVDAEETAKEKLTLNYVNPEETKLYIFPSDSSYRTVWRVVVGKARLSPDQWECLIDAESGDILYKSNLTRTE